MFLSAELRVLVDPGGAAQAAEQDRPHLDPRWQASPGEPRQGHAERQARQSVLTSDTDQGSFNFLPH